MDKLNTLHFHAKGECAQPCYVFPGKSLLRPEDHLFRGGLDVPVGIMLRGIVVVVSAY